MQEHADFSQQVRNTKAISVPLHYERLDLRQTATRVAQNTQNLAALIAARVAAGSCPAGSVS
jgi:hypothetical protein